jgi:hypothetical protein
MPKQPPLEPARFTRDQAELIAQMRVISTYFAWRRRNRCGEDKRMLTPEYRLARLWLGVRPM